MLARGYFEHGSGLLRQGDLIYVSIRPPEVRGGAAPGEARMALVTVGAEERDPARGALGSLGANHQGRPGAARVRDFGRPGDGPGPLEVSAPLASDAPAPPTPAKRGRPPGSKNKKPV